MTKTRQEHEKLKKNMASRRWRICNLYKITNKAGDIVNFIPNSSQEKLLDDLHNFNVILKDRQRGFSTLADILILDAALFNSNINCGIIAHTLPDAEEIFRTKIKFVYENLPESIKSVRQVVKMNAKEVIFNNGSRISVGTSMRSGTLQFLHISEFGKICARDPNKAREIITGSLNTLENGSFCVIESTAEGQEGRFFDICQEALKHKRESRELSVLDYKMHFFGWWMGKDNEIFDEQIIPEKMQSYFKKSEQDIKKDLGVDIKFTKEQKNWYMLKKKQQGEDMKREFPATPTEAFEQAIEGAYFADEMTYAREDGRICKVPVDHNLEISTYWDLGDNDDTTIWLVQKHRNMYRIIGYYEANNEVPAHYATWLNDFVQKHGGYFGTHYLPHDAKVREKDAYTFTTREDMYREVLTGRVEVVPRIPRKSMAIHMARSVLKYCEFDAERVYQGIKHLDKYRKEWDDRNGVWRDQPKHDSASHGADGFMTFAQAVDGKNKDKDFMTQKLNYNNNGIT